MPQMENFKPNRGEMGHIYSAGGINFSGEYLTALTGTGLIHLFLPLEKTKEGRKHPENLLIISDFPAPDGRTLLLTPVRFSSHFSTQKKKKKKKKQKTVLV